jgi:hypothetical protein
MLLQTNCLQQRISKEFLNINFYKKADSGKFLNQIQYYRIQLTTKVTGSAPAVVSYQVKSRNEILSLPQII